MLQDPPCDTYTHPCPPLLHTCPPVEDPDEGPAVAQEEAVPPGAEGQAAPLAPPAARHLAVPALQQPQGLALRAQVLPHTHVALRRAAEHQRTLGLVDLFFLRT